MDRSRLTRWAAPIAFLAAITILALVVRAGFEQGQPSGTKTPPPTVTTTAKRKKTTHTRAHHRKQTSTGTSTQPAAGRTYVIQSGDTLATIATKEGTTVAQLEQLNPGIDPTALRVGQTITVQ